MYRIYFDLMYIYQFIYIIRYWVDAKLMESFRMVIVKML